MGQLRDRMEGDLLLKGLADATRAEYVRCARQFAAHYRRSPTEFGAEDVRALCVANIPSARFESRIARSHCNRIGPLLGQAERTSQLIAGLIRYLRRRTPNVKRPT